MIKRRTYDILGGLATLVATVSLVLSLLAYSIGYSEYLYYAFIWCIILFLVILAWKNPPKPACYNEGNDIGSTGSVCNKLREVAELISILYSMEESPRIGYDIELGRSAVIARLTRYKGILRDSCSSRCAGFLIDIVELGKMEYTEDFLVELRECMLEHGCEPNIELSN